MRKREKIKKEINPKLENFLRKNRVYTRFINNTVQGSRLIAVKLYNINGAFTWSCAPEGHEFWAKIHQKYINT